MGGFPLMTSFWFDPTIEASSPLSGTQFADVAVVGGGFAGLSAARHLKLRAPGLNVALIEAEHAGFGASGRNAGWVMGLPPLYWLLDDLAEHRRLDDVRWTTQFARTSNAEVGRLVAQEAINCDWTQTQHVLVARNATEVATLRWLAPRFEAIGVPCERYDGKQVEQVVGYAAKGALAYDINTVQPYRLAAGLRRHCLAHGVRIYERTPVMRIRSNRRGITLTVAGGATLTAHKIVLATNAYTKAIEVDCAIPSTSTHHTYMLATEKLDAGTLQRIAAAGKPFGDAAVSFHIGRLHDRRLIFNGIDRSSQVTPDDDRHVPAYTELYAEMLSRFPFLRAVRLAGAWGGAVQQTSSDAPIVRTAPGNSNLILNIGYGGGSGVGMALLSGRLTADLVVTEKARDPDAERLRSLLDGSRFPAMGPIRAAFGVLRHLVFRF